MKKNGFLFQVDILKWENLKIAQEITSRLHYRGLLLSEYRRGICLILKETMKKKCVTSFFSFSRSTIFGVPVVQ